MATEGKLPKLLIAIQEAVGINATPTNKKEPTGLVDFLFSPNNKTGTIRYDRGNNKYGEVEVKYIPRGTRDTVQTAQTSNFSTANKPTFRKANASVSATFFQQFGLMLEDVEQILEGETEMLSILMASEMEGLRQRLEEFYAAQITALFGVNRVTGDNLVREIPLLTSAGYINPLGITTFRQDMRKNIFGNLAIIGDGNMMRYSDLVGVGTPLVDGAPTNSAQLNFDPYLSFETETNLGVNQVIVAEYGALQPITLNRYRDNSDMEDIKNVMMDTVFDDTLPELELDLKIKFLDGFPEQYFVEFGGRFGLFVIPEDAYKSTDLLFQNNGVLRYQFTQAS
ncbi:MAG: hypothetical protein AAF734_05060 [Bacteroidota bacterium]